MKIGHTNALKTPLERKSCDKITQTEVRSLSEQTTQRLYGSEEPIQFQKPGYFCNSAVFTDRCGTQASQPSDDHRVTIILQPMMMQNFFFF
jgi:hypothetical protein